MTVAVFTAFTCHGSATADTIGVEGAAGVALLSHPFAQNDFSSTLTINVGTKKLNFYGDATFSHTDADYAQLEESSRLNPATVHVRIGDEEDVNRRFDYRAGMVAGIAPRQALALQAGGYSYFPTTCTATYKKFVGTDISEIPAIDINNIVSKQSNHSHFNNFAGAYSLSLDSVGGRTFSARIDLYHLSGQRGVKAVLTNANDLLGKPLYTDTDRSNSGNLTASAGFKAPALGAIANFDAHFASMFSERKSTYILNDVVNESRQLERLYRGHISGEYSLGIFTFKPLLAAEYINRTDNIEGSLHEDAFHLLPDIGVEFSHRSVNYALRAARTIQRPSLARTDGLVRQENDMMTLTPNVRLHSSTTDVFSAAASLGKHTFMCSYTIAHSPFVTTYTIDTDGTASSTFINFPRSTLLQASYAFSGKITRWWELNAKANIGWQQIRASVVKSIHWQRGIHITSTFDASKFGSFEIRYNYDSRHIEGNIIHGNNSSLDADWSKSFGKLNIVVGIRDIFDKTNDLLVFQTKEYFYLLDQKPMSRRLHLGITYNFSTSFKPASRRIADISQLELFDYQRL